MVDVGDVAGLLGSDLGDLLKDDLSGGQPVPAEAMYSLGSKHDLFAHEGAAGLVDDEGDSDEEPGVDGGYYSDSELVVATATAEIEGIDGGGLENTGTRADVDVDASGRLTTGVDGTRAGRRGAHRYERSASGGDHSVGSSRDLAGGMYAGRRGGRGPSFRRTGNPAEDAEARQQQRRASDGVTVELYWASNGGSGAPPSEAVDMAGNAASAWDIESGDEETWDDAGSDDDVGWTAEGRTGPGIPTERAPAMQRFSADGAASGADHGNERLHRRRRRADDHNAERREIDELDPFYSSSDDAPSSGDDGGEVWEDHLRNILDEGGGDELLETPDGRLALLAQLDVGSMVDRLDMSSLVRALSLVVSAAEVACELQEGLKDTIVPNEAVRVIERAFLWGNDFVGFFTDDMLLRCLALMITVLDATTRARNDPALLASCLTCIDSLMAGVASEWSDILLDAWGGDGLPVFLSVAEKFASGDGLVPKQLKDEHQRNRASSIVVARAAALAFEAAAGTTEEKTRAAQVAMERAAAEERLARGGDDSGSDGSARRSRSRSRGGRRRSSAARYMAARRRSSGPDASSGGSGGDGVVPRRRGSGAQIVGGGRRTSAGPRRSRAGSAASLADGTLRRRRSRDGSLVMAGGGVDGADVAASAAALTAAHRAAQEVEDDIIDSWLSIAAELVAAGTLVRDRSDLAGLDSVRRRVNRAVESQAVYRSGSVEDIIVGHPGEAAPGRSRRSLGSKRSRTPKAAKPQPRHTDAQTSRAQHYLSPAARVRAMDAPTIVAQLSPGPGRAVKSFDFPEPSASGGITSPGFMGTSTSAMPLPGGVKTPPAGSPTGESVGSTSNQSKSKAAPSVGAPAPGTCNKCGLSLLHYAGEVCSVTGEPHPIGGGAAPPNHSGTNGTSPGAATSAARYGRQVARTMAVPGEVPESEPAVATEKDREVAAALVGAALDDAVQSQAAGRALVREVAEAAEEDAVATLDHILAVSLVRSSCRAFNFDDCSCASFCGRAKEVERDALSSWTSSLAVAFVEAGGVEHLAQLVRFIAKTRSEANGACDDPYMFEAVHLLRVVDIAHPKARALMFAPSKAGLARTQPTTPERESTPPGDAGRQSPVSVLQNTRVTSTDEGEGNGSIVDHLLRLVTSNTPDAVADAIGASPPAHEHRAGDSAEEAFMANIAASVRVKEGLVPGGGGGADGAGHGEDYADEDAQHTGFALLFSEALGALKQFSRQRGASGDDDPDESVALKTALAAATDAAAVAAAASPPTPSRSIDAVSDAEARDLVSQLRPVTTDAPRLTRRERTFWVRRKQHGSIDGLSNRLRPVVESVLFELDHLAATGGRSPLSEHEVGIRWLLDLVQDIADVATGLCSSLTWDDGLVERVAAAVVANLQLLLSDPDTPYSLLFDTFSVLYTLLELVPMLTTSPSVLGSETSAGHDVEAFLAAAESPTAMPSVAALPSDAHASHTMDALASFLGSRESLAGLCLHALASHAECVNIVALASRVHRNVTGGLQPLRATNEEVASATAGEATENGGIVTIPEEPRAGSAGVAAADDGGATGATATSASTAAEEAVVAAASVD